ncbi:MAG: TIGR02300 family protein [Rickettsiales bacterium]
MFTTSANAALGHKQTCLGCQAKFYDLNKAPAVCPKCHETLKPVIRSERRPARRRNLKMN